MKPTRAAFTLVELMIVVAIIGILAAIAIPNFVAMQYRAKRAEIPPNVNGIKIAAVGYDAAHDGFLDQATWVPSTPAGKAQRAWEAGTAFDTLGWAPDGAVRGQYKMVTLTSVDVRVIGESDVDGDGVNATYTATKSIGATPTTTGDVY
jgi:type IV pilus assembly protein PilA